LQRASTSGPVCGPAAGKLFGIKASKIELPEKGPVTAILDFLNVQPSDFIVLATHGREGMPRWLHGSGAESVVADLEGHARRIIAHCGLAWDARCLSFHTTVRPVKTSSVLQVRQQIYRSAAGRAHLYKEFLGPLKDALAGTR
jgi:hypothetical protein